MAVLLRLTKSHRMWNDDLDEISMGDIPDSDFSIATQSSIDYDLDGDISDSDVSFASHL